MSAARALRQRRPTDDRSSTWQRASRRRLDRLGPAIAAPPLALIVLGASILVAGPAAYAAQGPVGLGTANSFAVLGGSGITNTGPTTVTGDMGTFPTPSETGFGSITLSGTNHAGDAVTQAAKNDLITAYNDAFGRKPATSVPVELGGRTLLAGVYSSPTFGMTGTLALDAKGNANAEFIFQAGSTLITASSSQVLLLNGADPCHVVWQVGSSATFGTGTHFVGDVLAHTSITATTGATFRGRLLARDGAVTLDTNTINRSTCAPPAAPSVTTSTTVGTATGGKTPPTTAAGKAATPSSVPGSGPGASATPVNRFAAPAPATPGAGSASVTGTPALAPGPPTATPGAPPMATPGVPPSQTSGTPPSQTSGTPPGATPGPPFLAFTGLSVIGLAATALALLGLGALGVAAGRRHRSSHAI